MKNKKEMKKRICKHKAIAKGNGEKEWRCVFCGKIKNPSRSPKKELYNSPPER